jgi:hypothetical protein
MYLHTTLAVLQVLLLPLAKAVTVCSSYNGGTASNAGTDCYGSYRCSGDCTDFPISVGQSIEIPNTSCVQNSANGFNAWVCDQAVSHHYLE